jgi:glutamate formiminotransferase/formiminotetrahydrofolate cyclodeaminase
MEKQLIECVPNFSEGHNMEVISLITDEIESVEGVRLLDVDPGKATNRTVVTFVGEPQNVIEAAFLAIKKASVLIDMKQHSGEHPRMGATDVCPLIPISGISMEETAEYARKLGERVGSELDIPVYLYENAQRNKERSNLAVVRAGEYEGMFKKVEDPQFKPDYGPAKMNAEAGCTAIGARDFLIAYNINLNTTSTRIANRIAFDVREAGRVKREGNPYVGKIVNDDNGEPIRIPGTLKHVKAIGWYIEEYKVAQISMNLTNFRETPVHMAFEEVFKSATSRGVKVTGSELVGLIPLSAMRDAGKYFLKQQDRSVGVSESDLIHIAIKSMGLDELGEFDPKKKIIEYMLEDESDSPLVNMKANDLADETASESPAPGGGSISAYTGVLGVSLGTMVANLSANKKGWEDRVGEFSEWAEKGQHVKDELLYLVDEDTRSFNGIINALRMPKGTAEEKALRLKSIEKASQYATSVPFQVMKTAAKSLEMLEYMVNEGNPNSLSDAGVGLLCVQTAVQGAFMNVRINAKDLSDREFATNIVKDATTLMDSVKSKVDSLIAVVESQLN